MHDVNLVKIMILRHQKCASRPRRVQKMKNHDFFIILYKIVKKKNVVPMQHVSKKNEKKNYNNKRPKLGTKAPTAVGTTFLTKHTANLDREREAMLQRAQQ